MSIEEITRVGHAQATRRPVDQPDAKRGLKLLEAMAHCGLRHVQIAASGGDTAALRDPDEIAEIVEVKHRRPFVQAIGQRE